MKTFPQGIHPPEHKAASQDGKIKALPMPERLLIPFRQHIGAPCKAVTKRGAEVAYGDLLADEGGFISTRIHAGASGKIKTLAPHWHPNGRKEMTAQLNVSEAPALPQLTASVPLEMLERYKKEAIIEKIQTAGIVGLGGAGFPTHVKLQPPAGKIIDTVVLNACECEPYLNADNRLMLERPEAVVFGLKLAMKAVDALKGVISIESNKPEAAEKMREACANLNDVEIMVMKTQYPQGAEKMTIMAALGRKVPEGGLPMDVGVVVTNVGTAVAMTEAVVWDKPLTHRVLTVAGAGVNQPSNLYVPLGATIGDCIEFCGGLNDKANALVLGGPMMGLSETDLGIPVIKTTSGILALTEDDLPTLEETPCIRCGRCVDRCPVFLAPSMLYKMAKLGNWERMKNELHLMNCMECGCCAYTCPAGLPLVQYFRIAKAQAPK